MINFSIREKDQSGIEILSFVSLLFKKIFLEDFINGEQCEIYNDIQADSPMLVYTENPCLLRLSLPEGYGLWNQYIYQLSHELVHYVIRQTKSRTQKFNINSVWFEETLCEAFSLYTLKWSADNWSQCELSQLNSDYQIKIENYLEAILKNLLESKKPEIDNLEQLLTLNRISQDKEGRTIRNSWVLEFYTLFCNQHQSIKTLLDYHKYESDILPIIDFSKWINDNEEDRTFIQNLSRVQPRFLTESNFFLTFNKHIEPDELSKLYVYILVLNSIQKSIQDFKSDPVDMIKDQVKISSATYSFQDLLNKVFIILPFKVDLNSYKPRIISKPNDNLFYKGIYANFWTNELIKILDEENVWFFYFNYFFRNASMHYKHLIDTPGHLGSHEGIISFDFKIEIAGNSRSQNHFIKILENNEQKLLFDDKITISHKGDSKNYSIESSIDVDLVISLASKIKVSFIAGLNVLIDNIKLLDDEVLVKLNGINKNRYISVLNNWKNTII